MRTFLLTTGVVLCLATSANAGDTCMKQIPVPIKFERGNSCWIYHGVGTTFTGTFVANQTITAKAYYESNDEASPAIDMNDVQLSADGPHLRLQFDNDSTQLKFRIEQTQPVTFRVSPCAAWVSIILIEICAK
jgi:hypothetical protein